MNLARLIVMVGLLLSLTTWFGLVGAAMAVTLPMAAQFGVGVYLSRKLIGAPIALTLAPLAGAAAQSVVLAGVIMVAKSLMTADPRIALLSLVGLAAVVSLALNLRIRTLLAAPGMPGIR